MLLFYLNKYKDVLIVLENPFIKDNISNMMLILIADTLTNTNSLEEISAIEKMNQINILDQTIKNFEGGVFANDFDNLGFLLQLCTKLLIHLREGIFPQVRMEKLIDNSFEMIISKKQILKNINQFKPNDDIDAIKNLVEEYIDISNVHRPLLDYISDKVTDLMITVDEINERVIQIVSESKGKRELYENLKIFSKEKLPGGWFDIEYTESTEVVCNKLFSNVQENDGLSELEHRILVEEFNLFEKMKNDFIIFLSKFFDNTKTNIYQNIIEKFEQKTNKKFFDFLFISLTQYNYSMDFFKIKKYLVFFIKIVLDTSNKQVLINFIEYFKSNIFQFAKNAEN